MELSAATFWWVAAGVAVAAVATGGGATELMNRTP